MTDGFIRMHITLDEAAALRIIDALRASKGDRPADPKDLRLAQHLEDMLPHDKRRKE
jgi:hypothetical protein